ncbi:MAG TPA: YqgE/AlgH family protein [Nitrospiria bacterium]
MPGKYIKKNEATMGILSVIIGFFVIFLSLGAKTVDENGGGEKPSYETQFQFLNQGFLTQERPGKRVEKGILLVADPKLQGSYFERSVILITDHGSVGSLGVIVNRPASMRLFQVLPDIEELKDRSDILYVGGPVSPQSLVLLLKSQHLFDSSYHVMDDIYFSGEVDTLLKVITKADPEDTFRVYSGYSGWAPGQLDGELARGVWRVLQGVSGDIFNEEPESVWEKMIRRSSQQFIQGRENIGVTSVGLTDSVRLFFWGEK